MSSQNLLDELMCPICLNMLEDTMTSTVCLHRFCSDCILTAIQHGNKECPMCRKLIVSKRSLLPDPTFDLLISQIYPSRYEYDAHQTKELEEQYKSRSQVNLVQTVNEDLQIQEENNLQCADINQEDEQNENGCSSTIKTPNNIESDKDVTKTVGQANAAQKPKAIVVSEEDCSVSTPIDESDIAEQDDTISGVTSDEIVELVLRLHPTKMSSDNPLLRFFYASTVRYLKTTANATVNHISKYMSMRFAFEGAEILPFLIYIASPTDQNVPLNGNQTLRQILDKYPNMNTPLEMFYSFH